MRVINTMSTRVSVRAKYDMKTRDIIIIIIPHDPSRLCEAPAPYVFRGPHITRTLWW